MWPPIRWPSPPRSELRSQVRWPGGPGHLRGAWRWLFPRPVPGREVTASSPSRSGPASRPRLSPRARPERLLGKGRRLANICYKWLRVHALAQSGCLTLGGPRGFFAPAWRGVWSRALAVSRGHSETRPRSQNVHAGAPCAGTAVAIDFSLRDRGRAEGPGQRDPASGLLGTGAGAGRGSRGEAGGCWGLCLRPPQQGSPRSGV